MTRPSHYIIPNRSKKRIASKPNPSISALYHHRSERVRQKSLETVLKKPSERRTRLILWNASGVKHGIHPSLSLFRVTSHLSWLQKKNRDSFLIRNRSLHGVGHRLPSHLSPLTMDWLSQAKFWILLILSIPSTICSLLILTYFYRRPNQVLIHHHLIIVLLVVSLFEILFDMTAVMAFYRRGYVAPATAGFCTWWTVAEYSANGVILWSLGWGSVERHLLIFHNTLMSTRRKRFIFHFCPMVLVCLYPCLFYFSAVALNSCQNRWDLQYGKSSSSQRFDNGSLCLLGLVFHSMLLDRLSESDHVQLRSEYRIPDCGHCRCQCHSDHSRGPTETASPFVVESTTEAHRPTGDDRHSLHDLLVSTGSERCPRGLSLSATGDRNSSELFLLSDLHGPTAPAVCLTLASAGLLQLAIQTASTSRWVDREHHLTSA